MQSPPLLLALIGSNVDVAPVSSWRGFADDNVINMCELKFYSGEYEVDKPYYKTLLTRESLLQKMVSPKVVIRSTLVTTFELFCPACNTATVKGRQKQTHPRRQPIGMTKTPSGLR